MLLLPVFILVFCSGSVSVDNNKKKMNPTSASAVTNNIVVLELFTSQGCSSCPAADRLLGSYSNKENIVALSYHVDYWNRLGWKDPFSNAAYTKRQGDYASIFKASGVYTPQLIINGQREMVGSDDDKIATTIKQYQKEPASSQLIIDEIKTDNNRVSVTYSVKGKINNSVVNVALVQNKITTAIKAGENGGVTLTNYNVVRNFKTIDSINEEKNTTAIDLISGTDKKEFSVILFLQDVTSNKIYAATKSSL
ncbi:MAG: DUF1223 domain-containing protein [Chitinophagaceae bacterium]